MKTFGVWLGDEPVPEHTFDEVITSLDDEMERLFERSMLPDGVDRWRVMSDIVRFHEGTKRVGWLYHDFDCRWKGEVSGKKTRFPVRGEVRDFFCFYVGSDGIPQRVVDWAWERQKKPWGISLGRDSVFAMINKKCTGAGKLPQGSYRHG